jgi:hypothetical protein
VVVKEAHFVIDQPPNKSLERTRISMSAIEQICVRAAQLQRYAASRCALDAATALDTSGV